MENENVRVSAENSEDTQSGYQPSQGRFVASWEPKASRMLKLSVTDGFQTLEAIEHERIGQRSLFKNYVTFIINNNNFKILLMSHFLKCPFSVQ